MEFVYASYNNPKNRSELSAMGLYIDELSAVITDEFIELLNKCRGAKLEITSAFQSLSDIQKLSPALCEQVLENSLNFLKYSSDRFKSSIFVNDSCK